MHADILETVEEVIPQLSRGMSESTETIAARIGADCGVCSVVRRRFCNRYRGRYSLSYSWI
jgi:hypothetical protein